MERWLQIVFWGEADEGIPWLRSDACGRNAVRVSVYLLTFGSGFDAGRAITTIACPAFCYSYADADPDLFAHCQPEPNSDRELDSLTNGDPNPESHSEPHANADADSHTIADWHLFDRFDLRH